MFELYIFVFHIIKKNFIFLIYILHHPNRKKTSIYTRNTYILTIYYSIPYMYAAVIIFRTHIDHKYTFILQYSVNCTNENVVFFACVHVYGMMSSLQVEPEHCISRKCMKLWQDILGIWVFLYSLIWAFILWQRQTVLIQHGLYVLFRSWLFLTGFFTLIYDCIHKNPPGPKAALRPYFPAAVSARQQKWL